MIRRGIGVGSFVAGGPVPPDADATAFITAAAITDATQQSAINTLVVDLKAYGVWTKMKAIYPFVGGTASTHKFNLKDPRDLDAAFRLVFSGGWTHSSTGALPNGTNAYANTYFAPNSLGLDSAHLSIYNINNTNGSYVDMGSTNSSTGGDDFQIISRFTNINYSILNSKGVLGFLQTVSNGFSIVTRTNSTSFNYFIDTNKTAVTKTSDTRNSFNVFIGARNQSNTAQFFSNRQCAFSSIGDGLTDTEAANFRTAVQAYQTTLSRNV
jgi:hypothetical protein